jgi:acyl-CoA reductase-like NAD-dependent aldehyde dehydrogenase
MGGSSPSVVFDDVDLPGIIPRIYAKRFSNCGQSCNATKRLIVHESIFDEAVELLKSEIESKKLGHPDDEETDIGPLVAERQLKLLKEQIKDAAEKGAKIITGGKSPEDLKGAYFEPTLMTNISKDMRVWKEEVFGPALPVVKFKTEEEAVNLANDTKFGLGSNVYSKDKDRAKKVASRIKAGTVEINGASRWKTHLNPFGGYKQSGMGREHGITGFRELTQIKVVSRRK